ncbi:MAG: energy transducer TonB [Flavobacterium sp.]|jgi:periplasmic protein TonB
MEPKKNPNVDPRRNSFLYFSLGLFSMALLSYVAIEMKTYEKSLEGISKAVDDSFLDEDVPVTLPPNNPPPPPPPPPPAPEILKVVEDKKEIKEVQIQSTETNQQEEVKPVEAKKVVVIEEEVEVDVPFAIIEDVPLFPGCEKEPKDKQRECFQKKIQQFILKEQRYPEAAIDANIQGKVFVNFIIEKDGSISVAGMRGPSPILEKEAARIMTKMPKMIPGKQRGKPVRVPYSIPITFKLE